LKLRADEAALRAAGALHGRWLDVVTSTTSAEAIAAGLDLAQAGQVIALEMGGGLISAEVQGRAARPERTAWQFEIFSPSQWEQIIRAMAREAMDAARLVSGEIPPSLEASLEAMNLSLVPRADELEARCTCGAGQPCAHAAAAAWLAAERFMADPSLILACRGLPLAKLVDRVQSARALLTHGLSTAHGESMIALRGLEPQPLEQCLDDFWRPGPALDDLQRAAPSQHVSHALLRRLGPSPLGGRFPLVGLLASIYDTVTTSAIHLRDQAEQID
jgi:uncharacterized Zn finger protein